MEGIHEADQKFFLLAEKQE